MMITFKDILGQERAIETLQAALRADRLPHGLIFAGPVGIGKCTTARALSAMFLCEKPGKDAPCGKCASCQQIEHNAHPDVHLVSRELVRFHDKSGKSKATVLTINVIRGEVVEPAGRTPAMGRGKVFIIDEADLMNTEAQNALLKTLEEPFGRTLIILLTDQPEALLPTVRSRCQLIPFALLDESIIQRELQKRKIDAKVADTAARLSAGSLGQAIRWIEDGVIEHATALRRQLDSVLKGRVGADLETAYREAADDYTQRQLKRDNLYSKDLATREGLALYLRFSADFFRQQLHEEKNPEMLERLCGGIDAVAHAEQLLWSNVNAPLVVQQFSVALEREFESALT